MAGEQKSWRLLYRLPKEREIAAHLEINARTRPREMFDTTTDDNITVSRVRLFEHTLEHFGLNPIVAVDKAHILASGMVQTKVPGIAQAAVSLVKGPHSIRMRLSIAINNLARFVCRAIVNKQDFDGCQCLVKKTVNALF